MRVTLFLSLLVPGAYSFQIPQRVSVSSLPSSFDRRLTTSTTTFFEKQQISPPLPTTTTKRSTTHLNLSKKEVTPEKIAGRKKRVIAGYKIGTVSFGALAAVLLGVTSHPSMALGPFLASGLSYILIGAAENNRLSSDTYKRLNMAMIEYGFVGFVGGMLTMKSKLWNIACFIAFVNSIKGYGYGIKGWELKKTNVVNEMIEGTQSTMKSMMKYPNLKSVAYGAATVTVGALKLKTIAKVAQMIKSGVDNVMIGSSLFRVAQLMVLTIMMFTLKDAADRDRLEGTTFIELNFLSSISLAFMAAHITQKAGSMIPISAGLGLFSLVSAMNGLNSILKKKQKA